MAVAAYEPRSPEHAVLHGVVRDHLAAFLRAATDGADGRGLPAFVEREFREFLGCGVLARGFARVRCGDCAFERLVPFSCKGRGFCPSCGGRRMAAQAAHLVDVVLPAVPVRQWVLSLPWRLRYRLAWDHRLCRAVLAVHVRVVLAFYRRQARRHGVADGRGGTVTVIQRFGGGLNLNVHFHTLALDGVFAATGGGALAFHAAAPPTDVEVARVLATIHRRVRRLLCRRGLLGEADAEAPPDPLAEASLGLAVVASAAVQGRVALGPRAGRRVLQIGRTPGAPWVTARGARQAHLDGFDLHANLALDGRDRTRVGQLCRYMLRPPVAQARLARLADGRVLVTLKAAWHDGTTHLCFTPQELLERLAALIPRPRINLTVYHGVLAPNAARRAQMVAYGRGESGAETGAPGTDGVPGSRTPRHWAWAALMRRVFEVDVLACPRCGGQMRLLATIEDAAVVRRILEHLGVPTDAPTPRPARSPPDSEPELFR